MFQYLSDTFKPTFGVRSMLRCTPPTVSLDRSLVARLILSSLSIGYIVWLYIRSLLRYEPRSCGVRGVVGRMSHASRPPFASSLRPLWHSPCDFVAGWRSRLSAWLSWFVNFRPHLRREGRKSPHFINLTRSFKCLNKTTSTSMALTL